MYSYNPTIEGVDYFVTEGRRAFATIEAVAIELHSLDLMTQTEFSDISKLLLQSRRYIKADFRVLVCPCCSVMPSCRPLSHICRKRPKDDNIKSVCNHSHTHICESCEQLQEIITVMTKIVTNTTKHEYAANDMRFRINQAAQSNNQMTQFHLWSDNAACYKSSEMMAHTYNLGRVQSYNFYEAQNVKGPCDRTTATIKSAFRRHINQENDVVTANHMKEAIEKSMKNVRYRIKVVDNMTAKPKNVDRVIPSISTYSNFTFERNRIRVWKAYNIGQGCLFSNITSVESIKLQVIVDSSHINVHELKWKINVPETDSEDMVSESSINKQLMIMPSETKLSSSNSELDMGWALKDERKNKSFNKNQTDYLNEKFIKGQTSGRKEDLYSV
ncbi:unnamed protein product [Mytilus coruscus]|uniref:Uncharacterized protein n=1 Tax=Mytilus coruscus TaxID=42192 RepID=A0A6J8EL14_MYTCO|nr:unnamed protein product [Mytilus coruscus]